MDDLFADFLQEVDGLEQQPADVPAEQDACRKRPADEIDGDVPLPETKRRHLDGPKERRLAAEEVRKGAYRGDAAAVQLLLDGLSPVDRLLIIDDADLDDGFSALHLAVIRGHLDVVKALIDRRADVDCSSLEGDTPLMRAAHVGCAKRCKLLIRAGADASLKNKRGQKACDLAGLNGFRKIQELIESHDASQNASRQATVAANLKRRMAVETTAEARRARNSAEVAAMIKESKEQAEEEQYWAGIRERREARGEDQSQADGVKGEEVRVEEPDIEIDPSLPAPLQGHFRKLGLSSSASDLEVRKAYRKLALLHHPDKNPKDPDGAKIRFTELALAYEAVSEFSARDTRPKGVQVAPPRM